MQKIKFVSRISLILILTFTCVLESSPTTASTDWTSLKTQLALVSSTSISESASTDLTGIWHGRIDMFSYTTLFTPAYELRLWQTGREVGGEGELRYGTGRAKFKLQGNFDGRNFVGRTFEYTLVQQFTQDQNKQIFNSCRQLTFRLALQTGSMSQRYSYLASLHSPSPDDFVGDLLVGSVDGGEQLCYGTDTNTDALIRQPKVIVVMFGGYWDAYHKSVEDKVFNVYKSELKNDSRVDQAVNYQEYPAIGDAKKFIYQQLHASPYAKIALVGHSLGGNATFELAKALQDEIPEINIDLVVTLDPVTQTPHDVPHIRKGRGREPVQPKVAQVPPRPSNIRDWVNVYIYHQPGVMTSKDWVAVAGGTPWGKQASANVNLLLDGAKHGDADRMFFGIIDSIRPADKVKLLGESTTTETRQQLLQKLALLSSSDEPQTEQQSTSPLNGNGGRQDSIRATRNSEKVTLFEVESHLLTTFAIKRGEKVKINASGEIIVGAFAGASTPDGISGFENYSYLAKAPHGALLVRVNQTGDEAWTICGSSCSLIAENNGRLEFLVNDKDTSNNQGSYTISVLRAP